MDEKILRQVIDEVLYGKYKANVMQLSKIVNDQPMKSVDKAIWWIEYTMRHKGTKHLEYSGKYVPFYRKYMLDFVAMFILILHMVMGFIKSGLNCIVLLTFSHIQKAMSVKKISKEGKSVEKKIRKKKKE